MTNPRWIVIEKISTRGTHTFYVAHWQEDFLYPRYRIQGIDEDERTAIDRVVALNRVEGKD